MKGMLNKTPSRRSLFQSYRPPSLRLGSRGAGVEERAKGDSVGGAVRKMVKRATSHQNILRGIGMGGTSPPKQKPRLQTHRMATSRNIFCSDMLARESILSDFEQVAKDCKVTQLEIEDMLTSSMMEELSSHVSKIIFAGDRRWVKIRFYDSLQADVLDHWLQHKTSLMRDYERIWEHLPNEKVKKVIVFKAVLNIPEGTLINELTETFLKTKQDPDVVDFSLHGFQGTEVTHQMLQDLIEWHGDEDRSKASLSTSLSMELRCSWSQPDQQEINAFRDVLDLSIYNLTQCYPPVSQTEDEFDSDSIEARIAATASTWSGPRNVMQRRRNSTEDGKISRLSQQDMTQVIFKRRTSKQGTIRQLAANTTVPKRVKRLRRQTSTSLPEVTNMILQSSPDRREPGISKANSNHCLSKRASMEQFVASEPNLLFEPGIEFKQTNAEEKMGESAPNLSFEPEYEFDYDDDDDDCSENSMVVTDYCLPNLSFKSDSEFDQSDNEDFSENSIVMDDSLVNNQEEVQGEIEELEALHASASLMSIEELMDLRNRIDAAIVESIMDEVVEEVRGEKKEWKKGKERRKPDFDWKKGVYNTLPNICNSEAA